MPHTNIYKLYLGKIRMHIRQIKSSPHSSKITNQNQFHAGFQPFPSLFPPLCGNDPIWRVDFSDGLVQPPTTRPRTNSSLLKIDLPQKETIVFQSSIFRYENAVSWSVAGINFMMLPGVIGGRRLQARHRGTRIDHDDSWVIKMVELCDLYAHLKAVSF